MLTDWVGVSSKEDRVESENTFRPFSHMTELFGDEHRAFSFVEHLMGHTA
jgi:hypothetical protein